MDLFTYLMAKNGNNSAVHGDLFSYLLGKGQSQTQTISGVTIYIPDAKKLVSFMMTKESTQATSILPSGYTQVDYIQSSGTQYIDTGVLYSYGTRQFDLKAQFTNTNTGILISQQSDFNSSYIGNINGYWTCGDISSAELPITDTTLLSLQYIYTDDGTNPQSANIIYNNTEFNFARTSRFTTSLTKTIYLFKANFGSTKPAYAKLYYLKIYENNVLIRNFVPCYRNSDNEVGLYDLVNNVFYTNQGTGAFTYGSVAVLPNPDYPQEVKTVKGYRNLLPNNLTSQTINGIEITINEDKSVTLNGTSNSATNIYLLQNGISILEPDTYTMYCKGRESGKIGIYFNSDASTRISQIGASESDSVISKTFTISENTTLYSSWIYISNNATLSDLTIYPMLFKGTSSYSYVPYGNNYVNVAVSDGTNTNNYPIPLNNNEIVGIGDYKDELLVDKSGHVFINKKTGKLVLNGSENWADRPAYTYADRFALGNGIPSLNRNMLCNYFEVKPSIGFQTYSYISNNDKQVIINFSAKGTTTLEQFKTWLSTHNTEVYYVLLQEELIDLQTTVDLSLFKGVNNVSNSESGYMTIEYR